MSGIYIHIPFCSQRCSYCDFYSSATLSNKEKVLSALLKEMQLRKEYLQGETIDTVYFGGGTPSLLSIKEFEQIMSELHKHFDLSDVREFTIEANPDDLNKEFIKELSSIGVNRLSMGIQSFDDSILKFMNRRHDSEQAIQAVHNAVDCGIDNLSIDLIYGVPGLSQEMWKTSVATALNLPVQHISAYHLTYHEGTKLFNDLQKKIFSELKEEASVAQFELLIEETSKAEFDQYEVSNFAKKGFYSQHNSSYWKQRKYLGLGPSAHSYDNNSRQWNTASNNKYVNNVGKGCDFFEVERLSVVDKYNDYVITSMRTTWGIDVDFIENEFGRKYRLFFERMIAQFVMSKKVELKGHFFCLTKSGIFLSDLIISELFYVD